MAGTLLAPARRITAAAPRRRPIAWYAAPVAAVLSVGCGYVHFAYTASHWRDWWAYGLFFLATGLFQVLYGPVVMRRPTMPVALVGIAANLSIVGMYFLSRTDGVPIGPHVGVKERVGAVDFTTTAAEIVIVGALLLVVGPRTRRWVVNALLVCGVVLWVLRLTQ